MSRAISIVSVDDEKVSEKEIEEPKDEEFEKLMERIQRQRSALDEILGHEAKVESIKVEAKTAELDLSEDIKEEDEEADDTAAEPEVPNKPEKEVDSASKIEEPEVLVKTEEKIETAAKVEEAEAEESEEESIEEEKVKEPALVEEETVKVDLPEGTPTTSYKSLSFFYLLILNFTSLIKSILFSLRSFQSS